MKLRWWHLLATLALGLALGWAGKGQLVAADEAAASPDGNGRVRDGKASLRPGERQRPVALSHVAALREEIRSATADQIPALMRRAIDTGDHAERLALMLEAFSAVDDSNVAAVMKVFDDSSRETGRDNPRDWMIAAYLSGQKAGETMMKAWMEKGLKDNYTGAHETFWGWCSADPEAAERWLDSLGGEYSHEKERLMKALIGGMVIRHPEEAIERLSAMKEPTRSNCTDDLFWHLVEGQGVDRAVDWMLEVQAKAGPGDEAYSARVLDQVFQKICWAGGGRDGAAELAERLEKINSTVPLGPERLLRAVGGMDGVEALQLVDYLSDSSMLADESVRSTLVGLAVRRAMERNSAAAEKWLADHPDFASGQAR